MKVAIHLVDSFLSALKRRDTRRLSNVLSVYGFNVIDCNGNVTENFKKTQFFAHRIQFPKYYWIRDPGLNVSDIVFNVTSGSLKFVVELSNFAKNEITVKRFNGEYRIVSIRYLKCQNFLPSDPDAYLEAKLAAEDLMTRYYLMHQTKNTADFSKITTDPYTLTNNHKMKHSEFMSTWLNESLPSFYVSDIRLNYPELMSFRAKSMEGDKYEFMVSKSETSPLHYKLTSERIFVD